MNPNKELVVDKILQCRYKGHLVKGKILGFTSTEVWVNLLTNYMGKNEEWYIGEEKRLNRKEMSKIHVTNK